MNLQPIYIEPLDDLHQLITFQTGEKKIFYVFPHLSVTIRQPLKNKTFFQKKSTEKIQTAKNLLGKAI